MNEISEFHPRKIDIQRAHIAKYRHFHPDERLSFEKGVFPSGFGGFGHSKRMAEKVHEKCRGE